MEAFFTIILGVLLFAALISSIISINFIINGEKYALPWFFSSFIGILLFSGLFACQIKEYNKPYHGRTPTLDDVPEKARLIEHKIITGNDTTYKYTIEWNQEK